MLLEERRDGFGETGRREVGRSFGTCRSDEEKREKRAAHWRPQSPQ
jgi:hypothetical protein